MELVWTKVNTRSSTGTEPRLVSLLVFFVIFFLSAEFNVHYLVSLGAAGLLLLWQIARHRTMRLTDASLAVFVLVLVMFLNLREKSDTSVTFWLYWLIGIGFVVFGKNDPDGREPNVNRLAAGWIVIGLVTAAVILLSKAGPNLYKSLANRIYPSITRQYNLQLLKDGYSASVGRSISYTCYLLFFALAFVLCGNFHYWVKAGFTLFFLVVLAATGRRGETVAAAASVMIFLFVSLNRKKKGARILKILAVLFVVAAVLLLLWPWISSINVFQRFIQTLEKMRGGQDYTSGRTNLYAQALALFREHPVFGIGWDSFGTYRGSDSALSNVHNIYLQLLCETGIVGAVIILSIFAFLLVKAIRIVRRYAALQVRNAAQRLSVFSLMAQAFFLIVGLVDNPIYKPIIGMFYAWIIICMLIGEADVREIERTVQWNTALTDN